MDSGASATVLHVEETVQEKQFEGKPQLFRILKLDFLDTIRLKLYGNVKVGTIQRGDELADLYAFSCDRHGLQLATASGWSNRLVCEDCLKELEKENMRAPEDLTKTTRQKPDYDSKDPLKKYLTKNAGKNL